MCEVVVVRIIAVVSLAALVLMRPALADNGPPVTTLPQPVYSCSTPGSPSWNGGTPTSCPNNASSTIASTGTFQTVFSVTVPPMRRNGCTVQNNGTGTMWVFVGPKTLATKGAAYQLGPPANGQPGGAFYCQSLNSTTTQDEIAITGTSGDAFTALQN